MLEKESQQTTSIANPGSPSDCYPPEGIGFARRLGQTEINGLDRSETATIGDGKRSKPSGPSSCPTLGRDRCAVVGLVLGVSMGILINDRVPRPGTNGSNSSSPVAAPWTMAETNIDDSSDSDSSDSRFSDRGKQPGSASKLRADARVGDGTISSTIPIAFVIFFRFQEKREPDRPEFRTGNLTLEMFVPLGPHERPMS